MNKIRIWNPNDSLKAVLIVLFIFLAIATLGYAYSQGTASLSISYKIASPITLADGTILQYTPECLAECYLPIEISYAGSLSPATKSIQLTDLTTSKNKITGTDNLQSISYMYVSNDSYIESKWVQVIECVNTTQINLTVTTECYDNGYYKNTTKYGYFLKPLTSLTLQKAQPFILVLKGNTKASINKSAIDIVPSLYGFVMPELAWWNASWSSRKPYYIHENNNVARTNGTYDLTIDTASLISGGLLQSSCQDIRITKDDTLIPQIMITNCNNAATNVIFNASISASANQTFYFYYGNPTAPSVNTTVKLIHAETNMATARHDFLNVYAADEDYIYIADDAARSAHFFMYDRSSGTETARADMPETVDGSWSGWYNSTVCYACGDLGSGSESAKFACYDNTPNVWYTYSNSFNSKRQGQGHGVYGTLFCTAAGYDGGNTLRVECYDSSTGTIKQYASLKETWGMAHTAAVSKYLFVFAHKGIQRVDLVANQTVYMANQTYNADSSPQMAECVVNNNDIICYMFGGAASISAVSTIQFFNNTANTTVNVAETMITPRGQGGIVVIGDRIWLLGGYTNSWATNTKLVESFGILNYNVTILAGSETIPTSTQVYLNGGTSNVSYTYSPSTFLNVSGIINTTGIWIAIQKNVTTIANGTTSTWNNTIWEAGYFNFTAFWNGNETYSGSSSILYANISLAVPVCNLTITPVTPISYETNTTAICKCNNTDSGVTIKLYRNTTDVTTQNNTAVSLPANPYGYVCNSTATANYSIGSNSSNYVVNTFNANVQVSPGTQTISYRTSVNQYCLDNSSFYVCSFWRNNSLMSNNSNILLGAGIYSYVANITDISNYSNYQTTSTLNVSKATPPINFTITPGTTVTEGTDVNISCNYPSEISVNLYNDSSSISNPFIFQTTGKTGTWNYTCNSSATANYTSGTVSSSVTVGASGALIIAAVYDEKTLVPLTFNLTLYNATFSSTSNNIVTYNNNSVRGELTISISASGYVPRNYFVYISANDTVSMNGYLLKAVDGVYITYWSFSTNNPTGEYNSYHVFKRFITSSYVTIAESKADLEGKGTMFLDPYTNYVINSETSDGSLTWNSSSYNPNPSFILKISFGGLATGSNQTWLFTKTNYSLTPTDTYLRINVGGNVTQFNYTINDGNNSIEWYSMRLIYYNGTVLYFSNDSTHPSGGTILVNLNYTNLTSYLIAETLMKKTGYDLFGVNRSYIVWRTSSAIPDVLEQAASSGLSLSVLALISVFCSFAIAMVSNKWIRTGSGIIYLAILTIFGIYSMFPAGMLIGLWLMEIGIIMYREVW